MKAFLMLSIGIVLAASCSKNESSPDAYGNFIATEIMVSAETAGKVLLKSASEGSVVETGEIVFVIDTVQSVLKKDELVARKEAVSAKRANIQAQIAVLELQQQSLETDRTRIKNMLASGAAAQKQLDDLENNLRILDGQIVQVKTNFATIEAEISAIDASLAQVRDMIRRAKVVAPADGTILETYAEQGESVAAGRPLFKLADLKQMQLKAYFSGNQLAKLQIGEIVNVLVDDGKGAQANYDGTISWIAPDAEFTPKIIQTREERVSLVYAVKIQVVNDGFIKINMPGEVKLKGE